MTGDPARLAAVVLDLLDVDEPPVRLLVGHTAVEIVREATPRWTAEIDLWEKVVTAQALVSWRGNFYSVPPGLAGTTLTVSHRLASTTVDIATPAGTVLASHRREADGAGVMVRDAGHVRALTRAVLAAFDTSGPCARKVRRPPSPAALAEADHLTRPTRTNEREVLVDLARYAQAALDRQAAR